MIDSGIQTFPPALLLGRQNLYDRSWNPGRHGRVYRVDSRGPSRGAFHFPLLLSSRSHARRRGRRRNAVLPSERMPLHWHLVVSLSSVHRQKSHSLSCSLVCPSLPRADHKNSWARKRGPPRMAACLNKCQHKLPEAEWREWGREREREQVESVAIGANMSMHVPAIHICGPCVDLISARPDYFCASFGRKILTNGHPLFMITIPHLESGELNNFIKFQWFSPLWRVWFVSALQTEWLRERNNGCPHISSDGRKNDA